MPFTTQVADLSNNQHSSAVLNLLNEYAFSPEGGAQGLSDFSKNNLIKELNKRHDVLIVLAFQDTHAVGLLIGFEGFSTFACKPLLNIHDIIVSKAFRGFGLSQKLLQKAEEVAKERAYCKMTLEVLSQNQIAKHAYKKFGFTEYALDPNMGSALFWEKKLF